MKKMEEQARYDGYKIITSELKIRPFGVVKAAFVLMGIIPLLVFLYVTIGKHFFYDLLLGSDGLIIACAIFISVMGFLYAYNLVNSMVKKLLSYAYERKCADDEKTEMVIGVSHDLRTPLTVIKGGIDNVLEGVAGPISKVQADIVRDCLESINKLVDFVQKLLDVSKADFVRTNIVREVVDFGEIVRGGVNEISGSSRQKHQDLICEIRPTDLNIWVDKEKVSIAVMNILSNAVKYTPLGGRIEVAVSGGEDTVQAAITNTGPGIPPDELGRIFNKFEKPEEHAGIKEAGLGLSVARDIIDLHKGHITVKSRPGKETEFNIVLPRDFRTKSRLSW